MAILELLDSRAGKRSESHQLSRDPPVFMCDAIWSQKLSCQWPAREMKTSVATLMTQYAVVCFVSISSPKCESHIYTGLELETANTYKDGEGEVIETKSSQSTNT